VLRLHLEPGSSLDRSLQAVSRHLGKILEEGVREGYIRVWAYPRVESIIAGGVLSAISSSVGVRPLYKVSVFPPSQIDIPTIILGYSNPDYKASQVSSTLLSLSPEASAPPPPGAVYVTGEGSIAGILGLLLHEQKNAYSRRELLLLLLSASYYGGYVEKTGRFHGLDRAFYEALSAKAPEIDVVNTLKVYNPDKTGLCDAVAMTIDPYYPSLTGDPDACKNLLQANELEDLSDRIVSSLSERELERAALTILSHIQGIVKGHLEASDYIGSIVLYKSIGVDARLLANSIVHFLDSLGDPAIVQSLVYDPETLIQALTRSHIESASDFADYVENVKLVKAKLHSWLRGYMVGDPHGHSPLLLWRALKLKGLVEAEPLIIDRNGKNCVSALQVEEAKGYGEAKKLVSVKAAREDGLWLCVEESA